MQIGPFPQRDVEEVSKVLQEAGVPFEVQVDQDAVEKALAEAKQRRSTTMSDQFMDPATHYFEIPDEKIAELGNILAPFGVSLESDPNEPDGPGATVVVVLVVVGVMSRSTTQVSWTAPSPVCWPLS